MFSILFSAQPLPPIPLPRPRTSPTLSKVENSFGDGHRWKRFIVCVTSTWWFFSWSAVTSCEKGAFIPATEDDTSRLRLFRTVINHRDATSVHVDYFCDDILTAKVTLKILHCRMQIGVEEKLLGPSRSLIQQRHRLPTRVHCLDFHRIRSRTRNGPYS